MGVIEAIGADGVLLAIVAHFLIGISLVWDKVLLGSKEMGSLVTYVFWLGAMSVFGLVLIFFGFKMPPWPIAGLAFAAGIVDLIATYFYYDALKAGEASEELAAMGGFSPVATVLISIPLLGKQQSLEGQVPGFILMVIGGFVMFFAEKRPLGKMLPRVALAAGLFGLTNVLQKMAFNGSGFINGYVFFTIGTTVGALALLIPPAWRKQIVGSTRKQDDKQEKKPRSKVGYFVNRFLAGVGSFLVVFAVSRTNPATVEAISGERYVIIFICAWALTKWKPELLKETFTKGILVTKSVATALVVAGLVLVGLHGGKSSGGPT